MYYTTQDLLIMLLVCGVLAYRAAEVMGWCGQNVYTVSYSKLGHQVLPTNLLDTHLLPY